MWFRVFDVLLSRRLLKDGPFSYRLGALSNDTVCSVVLESVGRDVYKRTSLPFAATEIVSCRGTTHPKRPTVPLRTFCEMVLPGFIHYFIKQ